MLINIINIYKYFIVFKFIKYLKFSSYKNIYFTSNYKKLIVYTIHIII